MMESQNIRVLYMEDDPGLARLFQKKMKKHPFDVTIAKDGKIGLKLYQEQVFDALVLDYQMPLLNGIQVLQALKMEDRSTPVVMLTGAGSEEIAVEAMKIGASDYIPKDIHGQYFDILPTVINDAVERFRFAEEKRQMQQALKKYAEELERSNKDLQQFAYVVSHDLKEPLHTIRGFANFLEEAHTDSLNEEAHEFLSYIVDGTQRMERLIEGLLDYSRVKFKGIKMVEIDSQTMVENVVQDLKGVIDKRAAVVTIGDLPKIYGNERLLTRLFQNLIDNGLKYCQSDSPKISIDATLVENEWQFCITDNGIGIPQKHLERVFLIFQRLHKNGSYSGDGLGLAICKKIVENHHGKIWVKSKMEKGSQFYFTIPTQQEAVV